jgi:hypothetical protein
LQQGVTRIWLGKFHQVLRPQEISANCIQIQLIEPSPNFSFEFHFKSGQVPMGKDVPCLKVFPSKFDLKFLEPARASFTSN